MAEESYRAVREQNSDQCVVISGESGSGKTEASKLIMQYVAAVSGRAKEVNAIKSQLLQSNPVLEGERQRRPMGAARLARCPG